MTLSFDAVFNTSPIIGLNTRVPEIFCIMVLESTLGLEIFCIQTGSRHNIQQVKPQRVIMFWFSFARQATTVPFDGGSFFDDSSSTSISGNSPARRSS